MLLWCWVLGTGGFVARATSALPDVERVRTKLLANPKSFRLSKGQSKDLALDAELEVRFSE